MNDILHQISDQYRKELEMTQQQIMALVQQQTNEETKGHLAYVSSKSGHMLRPLVSLITFGAVSGKSYLTLDPSTYEKAIAIAAALELLHTASLVHDDVIDQTTERRSQPTLNAFLGNTESVLVGNLFYLNAFRLMLKLEDPWYLNVLIETAEAMCVGEILQNEKRNKLINSTEYLEIIQKKTGALISASAKLSAKLAGASEQEIQYYEDLAMNLGTLYQLRDDLQDEDLTNLQGTTLPELIAEKGELLKACLTDLDAQKPHQMALIQFIHYFKG